MKTFAILTLVIGCISTISYSQIEHSTSIETQQLMKEQLLVQEAPTERLKTYLERFPAKYVITESWYRDNIQRSPLNEFTREELAYFHRYMKRFETYESD